MGGTPRTAQWLRSNLPWLIGVALIATIVLWFVGIFALNRSAQYGRIPIPGSAVLKLPAGEVDLSLEAQVTTYGGNSKVSLPIPSLNVSVAPVGGGLIPDYQESVGGTTSVNSDAHREFAKLDIPNAGRYRVRIAGHVDGFIEPTLELGAPGLATKILLTGLSAVFLLALIYTLSGLVRPRPSAPPDAATHAAAAFGQPEAAAGPRPSRRPLPWQALVFESLAAGGLLILLLGGGSLHIAPRGRTDAPGHMVGRPATATTSAADLLESPLPPATAADAVAADNPRSLLRQANLAKGLRALTARIGSTAEVALMAIRPGELDLAWDDKSGDLHRVRVARDGDVTVAAGIPTETAPTVIYVNQVESSVIRAIERHLANEHVATRQIVELVLDNNLPNSTAGWNVKTMLRNGRPGPTFQARLDGGGLHEL